jgi:hypothetical protein
MVRREPFSDLAAMGLGPAGDVDSVSVDDACELQGF